MRRRPTGFAAAACAGALFAALAASATGSAPAAPPSEPRQDPLELQALTDPEAVLARLPEAFRQARLAHNREREALLYLAEANACRVTADWRCQRSAGANAAKLADAVHDRALAIRGMITQARAETSLKNYTIATELLARAELDVKSLGLPELEADIALAYSSMSYSLGKIRMSAMYAEQGLRDLGRQGSPAMRGRLLRNLARAQVESGDVASAMATLQAGEAAADLAGDPKLLAEIAIGSARIAKSRGDVATQRESAARIFRSAERLKNTQLTGLGHEALGDAFLVGGQFANAGAEYRKATASFQALRLDRDELRALRSMAGAMLKSGERDAATTASLLERMILLEERIETSDRAEAADDFAARLEYAQKERDYAFLQREKDLLQQRESALRRNNQLMLLLVAVSVAALAGLAFFYRKQRKMYFRLREANRAKQINESRISSLLQLSKGLVFIHDDHGAVIATNPKTAAAMNATVDGVVGMNLKDMLAPESLEDFASYLRDVVSKDAADCMLYLRDAEDWKRYWHLSGSRFQPEVGDAYAICYAVDLTMQARELDELNEKSLRDALTGAYNRRIMPVFEQRLGKDASWAVIIIDMDHFKQINDLHGHEEGDRVLVQVVRYLQERMRDNDYIVRLGGDEFAILLGNATTDGIDGLVGRIRRDMGALSATFSMGLAVRNDEEPLTATLARADMEMLASKAASRAN